MERATSGEEKKEAADSVRCVALYVAILCERVAAEPTQFICERQTGAAPLAAALATGPLARMLTGCYSNTLLLTVVGQECHGHGQPKTEQHGHAHSGNEHG